jgi:hypothetical protein
LKTRADEHVSPKILEVLKILVVPQDWEVSHVRQHHSERTADETWIPRFVQEGQRRPADAIGAAIMVARIATGEIDDTERDAAKEYARAGGLKGVCTTVGVRFLPGFKNAEIKP